MGFESPRPRKSPESEPSPDPKEVEAVHEALLEKNHDRGVIQPGDDLGETLEKILGQQ